MVSQRDSPYSAHSQEICVNLKISVKLREQLLLGCTFDGDMKTELKPF